MMSCRAGLGWGVEGGGKRRNEVGASKKTKRPGGSVPRRTISSYRSSPLSVSQLWLTDSEPDTPGADTDLIRAIVT